MGALDDRACSGRPSGVIVAATLKVPPAELGSPMCVRAAGAAVLDGSEAATG